MDAVIIGNPSSGQACDAESLKRCAEILGEHGDCVEVWPTEQPEHATELATLAGERLVVAAGGDGTINEVINGLRADAALGVLPFGTANVLARELGLPLDIEGACRRILEGEPLRIDLGVAMDEAGSERRFACMAGVGFDASVVRAVTPRMKRVFRGLAFPLTAFKVLSEDLPSFRIVHGGEVHEARFAIVANCHHYGGEYRIAHADSASLTSGLLETVLIGRVSRILRPDIFGGILARRPLDRRAHSFLSSELRALADSEVPVQLDGEVWGRLPMSFRVEPAALNIIR